MAKAMKFCRVCGNKYEACRTTNRNPKIFRWQDVACSPECGEIYLQRIEASRSGGTVSTDVATASATVAEQDVNISVESAPPGTVSESDTDAVQSADDSILLDVPLFTVSVKPSDNHTSGEATDS